MYCSMYVLSVTVHIDPIVSTPPRRESACGAHSIPKPGSRLCPRCKTNNLECSLRSTQGEGNGALEGRVHYPKWVKRLPSQEHSMSLPVLSPNKVDEADEGTGSPSKRARTSEHPSSSPPNHAQDFVAPLVLNMVSVALMHHL